MLFERRIVLVTGRLDDGLAAEAGQPAEEVAEDQRRGRYLDAREALDYGLIDGICITR
jgi:ATP-dependent protease ClpP protease subunit